MAKGENVIICKPAAGTVCHPAGFKMFQGIESQPQQTIMIVLTPSRFY